MKFLKRFCILFLVTLCLSCAGLSFVACENTPDSAFLTDGATEGLTYSLSEDKTYYTVTGIGRATDQNIVISSQYKNLPVKEIGANAFAYGTPVDDATPQGKAVAAQTPDVSKISSFYIPDSIVRIGESAFSDCYGLVAVTVDENNNAYCSEEGVLFDRAKTEIVHYPAGKANTSYTVPDGVKTIGDWVFSFNRDLSKVVLPDSVQTVGLYAFYACEKLADISLPETPISIGADAFSETAYYKEENNRTNGALYIGNYLLEAKPDTDGLGGYVVKGGTRSIAGDAFWGGNTREIFFQGTQEEWSEIVRGKNHFWHENKEYTVHCTDGNMTDSL